MGFNDNDEMIDIRVYPERFEGLQIQQPLYRKGDDMILFIVEHHRRCSTGGYQAVKRGKVSKVFHTVEDVVGWFNAH